MKKSSGYRKDLGNWGESFACQWLQERGYTLVKQNHHGPHGEIDLIMRLDDMLVAVEVKTRRSKAFGYGEDSITKTKLKAIFTTMTAFVMDNPELPDAWRLDVIAVEPNKGKPTEVHHFENVFMGDLDV